MAGLLRWGSRAVVIVIRDGRSDASDGQRRGTPALSRGVQRVGEALLLGNQGVTSSRPSLAIARRRRTLAAHCRISAVGVSDAPADRTDRHRLSPHNDLSPVRMPPAVKRLFIDYGVASSRPGVGGQGVAVLPGGASVPISSRPRQQRFSQVGHVFPLVWTAPAEGTPPWGARGKDL